MWHLQGVEITHQAIQNVWLVEPNMYLRLESVAVRMWMFRTGVSVWPIERFCPGMVAVKDLLDCRAAVGGSGRCP